MSDPRDLRAKNDLLAVLRRAGVPEEHIQALADTLDDPVDLTRDGDLLARYGISRDSLVDSLGGSP
jgi:hypothetical protein